MKILFICGEYPPGPHGGIGTFNREIARWLSSNGHQVKVIGTYSKSYGGISKEFDHGVEVYRIFHGDGKFDWIQAWLLQFNQIRKWVKKGEVDLIEAPDSRGWFAFWPKLNVPLVIRAHGSETYFAELAGKEPNRLTHFLEKKSYHRADYLVAVSQYVAQQNERLFNLKQKHTIIYNSLPPELKNLSIEHPFKRNNTIVYSGTLIRKKGIFSLINAVIPLFEKGLRFQVILNGKDYIESDKGSTINQLKALIPEKFQELIIFNGHQEREAIYKMYQQASLAVFPSYAEAFAIAPMEAMLNGCPTIYTKRVSGPELIQNNVNGILIDPDHIEELSNAIMMLLNNPDKAKELGDEGRKTIIEKFQFEKIMRENERFYQNCLSHFQKK